MNCTCGKALDKRTRYGLCRSCSARKHAPINGRNGGRKPYIMDWCPPDRREEYRALRVSKKLPAGDAKRMILGQS